MDLGDSYADGHRKDCQVSSPLVRWFMVRVVRKDNKSLVTTRTDARGHYSHTRLSSGGVYTVSVILDGAVKSSVNVKTTTNNSRIDFDLKPAAKKIKHYVWVDAKTGSHMGSGWAEVDDAGNGSVGASNIQTA